MTSYLLQISTGKRRRKTLYDRQMTWARNLKQKTSKIETVISHFYFRVQILLKVVNKDICPCFFFLFGLTKHVKKWPINAVIAHFYGTSPVCPNEN